MTTILSLPLPREAHALGNDYNPRLTREAHALTLAVNSFPFHSSSNTLKIMIVASLQWLQHTCKISMYNNYVSSYIAR